MHMLRFTSFLVAILLVGACTPTSLSSPPASDATARSDAASDGVSWGDVVDAPSLACTSDRDCSGMGQVCDLDRERCVQCNTSMDCASGQACLRNTCVTTVACTTSRMCPDQVCSQRLGYCVDCEADNDCPAADRCVESVCVPRPTPCTSDRDCSGMGLVCDPAVRVCVECVADMDCPMERWCSVNACRRQVCTPGESSCAGATQQRVCNARGSSLDTVTCPTGQTCRDDRCQTPVCAPGAMSCDPVTGERRVCAADGGGYAAMTCPDGQSCRDGACVPRVCSPGASNCDAAGARQVCNADGLGVTSTPCPTGQSCSGGECMAQVCSPGSATCSSDRERRVCDASGLAYTTVTCASAERCSEGVCRTLACEPSSSMCLDANRARVCSADGLTSMIVTCPSGSTCSGTTCTSWVCTPGEASCTSLMVRSVCNADGLAQTTTACPAPANASSATCAMGVCGFVCRSGYGDCNRVAADGCEAQTASSLSNCGSCGNVCPTRAHVATTCVAGACGFGACETGYGDCDGNNTNGCETDTRTSTAHCGMCGRACPVGNVCAMGSCTAAAPTQYTQSMPTVVEMPFLSACSAAGRQTFLASTDDAATTTALPFAFRFWTTDLAMGSPINVSTNGFISLDGMTQSNSSGVIPRVAAPNATVAPYWRDLVTNLTGICVATVGTTPARRWAVEWLNVRHYSSGGGGSMTFEVVLNETTDVIEFMYGVMDGALTATVGLENETGRAAISGCSPPTAYTCVPAANARVRFTPAP